MKIYVRLLERSDPGFLMAWSTGFYYIRIKKNGEVWTRYRKPEYYKRSEIGLNGVELVGDGFAGEGIKKEKKCLMCDRVVENKKRKHCNDCHRKMNAVKFSYV